ncbi:MAG: LysR family transcriptional regulator, partial [Burkholderiales bacterium]|nr:LysR family transcriptional regulator [Burkholderiales bacterium]
MDFRHFRYFVATADELHVGRAAERLGIAQPALSQLIRALEERLGVRLFIRANRRIALSEAGEAFLAQARAALHHADLAGKA